VNETITFETLRQMTAGRDRQAEQLITLAVQQINAADTHIASLVAIIEDRIAQIKEAQAVGAPLGQMLRLDRSGTDLDREMASRKIHWQNLVILTGERIATEAAAKRGL